MGRNLSLLARLPRVEADGVTHRRDCECVRCDAGFRPSEHERADARRRFEERRVRERAGRTQARVRERAQAKQAEKQAEMDAYVSEQVRAADEQVRALREARERAREDRRLEQVWALRRAGLTLREALERVEARPHQDEPVNPVDLGP